MKTEDNRDNQELLVDYGSYPTDQIARNSHDFRPLGLGYANLGSLLMSLDALDALNELEQDSLEDEDPKDEK